MLQTKRHELICKWLTEDKSLSIKELSQRLGASTMTIHRDLDFLDWQGLVKRVRGGVVATDSLSSKFLFDDRSLQNVPQKRKIADFAAKNLVQPKDILSMEGGTTVSMMTRNLLQPNLTILTNGLRIISDLADKQLNTTVLSTGGTVNYSEQIYIGPHAAAFFANFRVHKCFVGADGLTLKDGATEENPNENAIKRAMVEYASEVILLIDSSKIGTSSLVPAIEIDKINTIVTDTDAPQDIINGLAKRGVKVYTV